MRRELALARKSGRCPESAKKNWLARSYGLAEIAMTVHQRLARLYELPSEGGRLVPMEGLRGLAVLLVFFVHFGVFSKYLQPDSWLFSTTQFLARAGNAGVDLFFLLSGYLIYGALVRRDIPYFVFLARRVQRIYPAFLVVFALYVALSALLPALSKIRGAPIDVALYAVANVLLLPGIFPMRPIITVAWSLSYEFFFYLTIPVLVGATGMRAWTRGARASFFGILWLAYGGLCWLGWAGHVRLILFVAGILLYEAVASNRWATHLRGAGEIIVVLLLCVSFWSLYGPHTSGSSAFAVTPGAAILLTPYKAMTLSTAFFLLCLHSFRYRGLLQRVFSWAPLRWLGNMSYSYYLVHGLALSAVGSVVGRFLPPNEHSTVAFGFVFVLSFAAAWLAATALFLGVERPWSLDVPSLGRTKTAVHGLSLGVSPGRREESGP